MTVSELIKELARLDPDALVMVERREGVYVSPVALEQVHYGDQGRVVLLAPHREARITQDTYEQGG